VLRSEIVVVVELFNVIIDPAIARAFVVVGVEEVILVRATLVRVTLFVFGEVVVGGVPWPIKLIVLIHR